jgi:hypothetical protein
MPVGCPIPGARGVRLLVEVMVIRKNMRRMTRSVGVRHSLVRLSALASVTSATALGGNLGCGGRTAIDPADEVGLATEGGPAAALDAGSTGRAEDASPTATVDAGDAAACTAPGIYLITNPGASGQYSLAVFDPTSLDLEPLGSIALPGSLGVQDGIESVMVTRSGQITISSGGLLLPLDEGLAPTSPVYEWPRDRPGTSGDEPWGAPELTAMGLPDGGQVLLGLGPPVGLAEFEFDASSPVGTVWMFDASMLEVSQWVIPSGGVLMSLAGTGDGRLFALSGPPDQPAPSIWQIDPVTGDGIVQVDVPLTVNDVIDLDVIPAPFAFWAGDFYTFPRALDNPGAPPTTIVRLHPGATTRETVAQVDGLVVAATSSPCAPTQ